MLYYGDIKEQCDQLDSLQGITQADVFSFLHFIQNHPANANEFIIPIDQFLHPADFGNYMRAHDFWPLDAPPVAAFPKLSSILLQSVMFASAAEAQEYRPTFNSILVSQWNECYAWLVRNGRDPEHPRETAATRRVRKSREAAARRRAEVSADTAQKSAALAAKAAWQEWDAYRKRVKAEVEALEAQHAPRLQELWSAFQTLKNAIPLGKQTAAKTADE